MSEVSVTMNAVVKCGECGAELQALSAIEDPEGYVYFSLDSTALGDHAQQAHGSAVLYVTGTLTEAAKTVIFGAIGALERTRKSPASPVREGGEL